MVYQYRGKQTIAAELAAIEAAKQELAIREAEHQELLRLRRERRAIEHKAARILAATDELAKEPKPQPRMPEPLYGGPVGLRAACNEIAAYERRKRKQAA